jgi:hypothetical protein
MLADVPPNRCVQEQMNAFKPSSTPRSTESQSQAKLQRNPVPAPNVFRGRCMSPQQKGGCANGGIGRAIRCADDNEAIQLIQTLLFSLQTG